MSDKMRLFSLTDIETPELKKRHMVGATLAVQKHMIPPGESLEVSRDPATLKVVSTYVAIGAMAVDDLPPAYKVAKEKMKPKSAPPPLPKKVEVKPPPPEPFKMEDKEEAPPELLEEMTPKDDKSDDKKSRKKKD